MYAEANRGSRVLPAAFCRIMSLVGYGLRSFAEIMNPSLSVELVDDDFVFDVLKQTVDSIDTIETQLLHGKESRFRSAKVVKEEETTMKE